jgi:predicted NAD/FAD-dependent oxidoreductase
VKKIAFVALALVANIALAGPLTVSTYETVGSEKIPSAAKLDDIALSKVGSGIRQKRMILNFDVYRATLLASNATTFSRDTKGNAALDSLMDMKAAALSLQFMRDLSATKILESFEAALKTNDVKDSPALAQFKSAIQNGGDAVTGQTVTLSFNADKGVLTCEMAKNKVEIKGDAKFFKDIFSIWLGKPADSGLGKLRDALIKG